LRYGGRRFDRARLNHLVHWSDVEIDAGNDGSRDSLRARAGSSSSSRPSEHREREPGSNHRL
jgi:hypothetical protein